MRITYRKNDSFAYWTQRWADVEADEAMENRASYPLKYALEAVARSFAPNGGRICEAGTAGTLFYAQRLPYKRV